MNCTYHINNPISLICIASHKCQRKLCVECLDQHETNGKSIISINKFSEQVTQKLEEQKLAQKTSQQTKLLKNIRQLIINTEITLKKMWEYLSQQIKIFDSVEQEDQQFIQILNRFPSLAESSYSDLEKLVQFLNENNFKYLEAQKNSYSMRLSRIKNQLEQEVKMFSQKIKEQIKEISSLSKINQSLFQWKVQTYEIKSFIWYSGRLQRTQFSIAFTNNKEIQYIKDGEILRIDKVKDISIQPQVMFNFDQINNLDWSGSYGQNNIKIGRWKATWGGENYDIGGGEYKRQKVRIMERSYIEVLGVQFFEIQNNRFAQVYEIGKYDKGIRKGAWQFIYKNKKIGGGDYNDFGYKQGKWINIFENFFCFAQVTYNGEYNMKGMKVGRWDIMYCDGYMQDYKQGQHIVVVDHMMEKDNRKRLESGQNWMKNFMIQKKLSIKVNTI